MEPDVLERYQALKAENSRIEKVRVYLMCMCTKSVRAYLIWYTGMFLQYRGYSCNFLSGNKVLLIIYFVSHYFRQKLAHELVLHMHMSVQLIKDYEQ